MMNDGRIIDTGNKNISHSEGQGYGMLFAVSWGDRTSFDKIWQWTRSNLYNQDNGLFYWKYDPAAATPVVDKNNASDGDTLIAWALLKAGETWNDKAYTRMSDDIIRAILQKDVIVYAGYRVLLPGEKGFCFESYCVLNASYFIYPAWKDFARTSHLLVWKELTDNGLQLLKKMRGGEADLPADWMALKLNGEIQPASGWPARTSYDAIRIPLYVYWLNSESDLLAPWRSWWQQFSPEQTPAWVSFNGQKAPYVMNGGMQAVRNLITEGSTENITVTASDDYYSASLKLQVLMALRQQRQSVP